MSFHRKAPPALLAVCAALSLAACQREQHDDPRTGTPLVRAATVASSGQGERTFTGVVVARVQSNLGFRVAGKIVERLVDAGQAVRQGQALMRIDPADLALATRARDEAVGAARARARQTAADEQRYRDLVSAGAVSASAYDQARAAADTAAAQLNAAEAQARVARNESGYAVLLADADGVVMETLGEPGQVVGAGQPVGRLAHGGPREASIELPETLRPALGSAAQAVLYGGQGGSVPARLRQLSDEANPQSRTFEARYVLENSAAPLGATVTVRLPGPALKTAYEVPLAALYDPQGKGPGVWVIDGKPLQVHWRPVQVAALGGETASVSGGLKPGERFVALGAHLLHDGQAVRLAAGAAHAASAASAADSRGGAQ